MKRFALTSFGFISSVVSYFVIFYIGERFGDNAAFIVYLPGTTFGIAVAVYCLYFLNVSKRSAFGKLKLLAWIIISTFSFYAATKITVDIYMPQEGDPLHYSALFLAGAVGSILMLLGIHLLSKLTLKQYGFLVILGGFLGLSWFLGNDTINENLDKFFGIARNDSSFLVLLIVWQTGMAFALERILTKNSLRNKKV